MNESAAPAEMPTKRLRLERSVRAAVEEAFEAYDCVVILGPRRIGKSDLADVIANDRPKSKFVDVEKEDDIVARAIELFEAHSDHLIVLDEIQMKPDLFGKIRAYLDEKRRSRSQCAQFLLLGSASLDLIQEASHRLSGRFEQVLMSGFDINEISLSHSGSDTPIRIGAIDEIAEIEEAPAREAEQNNYLMRQLWLRGGLPDSYYSTSDQLSLRYRSNFLRDYFALDIPNFGFEVDGRTLERVFGLIADDQKGILSTQTVSNRLGCDGKTVRSCLYALGRLLLVREIKPWANTIRGEMDDRAQFYIRDSGLAHAVARLENFDQLRQWAHVGESWEAFAAEQLIIALEARLKVFKVGYFRTKGGEYEVDLVLQIERGPIWGIEMKTSAEDRPSKKNADACESVQAARRLMVHADSASFDTNFGFRACSLSEAVSRILDG